jgi:hypothetical protein
MLKHAGGWFQKAEVLPKRLLLYRVEGTDDKVYNFGAITCPTGDDNQIV